MSDLISTFDELLAAAAVVDSAADHLVRSALPIVEIPCANARAPKHGRSRAVPTAMRLDRLPLGERTLVFALPGVCDASDAQRHELFDATADLKALNALCADANKAATTLVALLPLDLLAASRLSRAHTLYNVVLLCDPDQAIARAMHLLVHTITAPTINAQ